MVSKKQMSYIRIAGVAVFILASLLLLSSYSADVTIATQPRYHFAVAVLSKHSDTLRRATLRATVFANVSFPYVFIVGKTENVLSEPDLVVLDVVDSHDTLAYKRVSSIQWAAQQNADFFVQMDSDSFVRFDALRNVMQQYVNTSVVYGRMIMFEDSLKYPGGMAYVISHSLTTLLARSNCETNVLYPFDDVMVGRCLRSVNATTLINDDNFHDFPGKGGNAHIVTKSSLVVHHLSTEAEFYNLYQYFKI